MKIRKSTRQYFEPTRKNFGPQNNPQEKILDPENTHKKIRDQSHTDSSHT